MGFKPGCLYKYIQVVCGGKLTIAHCTFDNMSIYGYRGESSGLAEGRESHLYNNIFNGTTLVHIGIDNEYEVYSGDYNIVSDTASASLFRDLENPSGKTLEEWRTLQTSDANSSVADPLLTSSGKINKNSPAVDTAIWITGVNEEGQSDTWGKYIHRLPNIGADQGAGAYQRPVTIRIGGGGIN